MRQVARRQALERLRQRLDHAFLLGRQPGALLGRRGLQLRIGRLPAQHFVGFGLGLLHRAHLERLDRGGDVADLVLAAEARQHDVEIAGPKLAHRDLHRRERLGDRTADQERGCRLGMMMRRAS